MARSTRGKIEFRGSQANNGNSFKYIHVEKAYPRATLLKRRVNQYFEYCDMNKKHYTLPGLGLFLGLRTRALQNYVPSEEKFEGHKLVIDYAMQRIEAYITERLFETKGSTKGTEFLLSNTLGYANKSEVNSKQELEITEKDRIQRLPDDEVKERLKVVNDKIVRLVKPAPKTTKKGGG
jgi:hypothetical protein